MRSLKEQSTKVSIDGVEYPVPTPVCDLLEAVSRERDRLAQRVKEMDNHSDDGLNKPEEPFNIGDHA